MSSIEKLITDNLDTWASAVEYRSTAGRGSSNKINLYGIKKLRELILELAVRGLLVPQDPNDEPAEILLDRIKAEKERRTKKNKVIDDELSEIAEDEKPCVLPNSWEWAHLGGLSSNIHYGYTASAMQDNNGIRMLRITDIQDDKVNWQTVPGCEIDEEKSLTYLLENDDILIARTGGTIGKSYLVENINVKSVFASYLIRVKRIEHVYAAYIKTFLGSQIYWTQLYDNAAGTGQPNVNATALKGLVVPIPPIEEQYRIVAKVNELMTLCDQLEQQQSNSIDAHQALVETLLSALTNAADKGEFNQAWTRIADHFDTLFTTEHSIDQLKQTILQLAVMGKLVPQDPTDEPASELLKKIKAEKEKLIKEGKIKKEKPPEPARDDEKLFELPQGWERVTLSHLGIFSGGSTPSKMNSSFWNGTIPWVTPKDMKVDYIYDSEDHVTQKAVDKVLTLVSPESLLFVVRSGILRRTLPVAISKVTCTVNQDLKVLTLFCDGLSDYIFLLLKGFEPFILSTLVKVGTTVESVKFEEFSKQYFMIPPLDEQQRIISKVGELINLCDLLKLKLSKNNVISINIANEFNNIILGNKEIENTVNQSNSETMKISTNLALTDKYDSSQNAMLSHLIHLEGGAADAKEIWRKSKLDLPTFYKQLKSEIQKGFILKPDAATFEG